MPSPFTNKTLLRCWEPLSKPSPKQAVTVWKSKFHGQSSQQFHQQTKSWVSFLQTTIETEEYQNNLIGRISFQQEITLNPISGARLFFQERLWESELLQLRRRLPPQPRHLRR